MNTYAVILAAGKGTRMQSDIPKVMHRVSGVPMVEHLVNKLEQLRIDEILVVVGYKGELVKAHLGSRVTYVEQHEQLGTAHAVQQAAPFLLGKQGETLVLTGDTPLIETSTMDEMIKIQRNRRGAGVVLTAIVDNPTGYGRIIRDQHTSNVIGIVEEKDANPEQKQIREVNTGIFCFDNKSLFEALPDVQNHNAQQEYYLTDIIPLLRKAGRATQRSVFESNILLDPAEVIGINTREQLAEAERIFKNKMQAAQ
jgi:UDP-N-acetylglucosamine diphosphorylase/glucosamine-1-phosphate N-acetyltransferase